MSRHVNTVECFSILKVLYYAYFQIFITRLQWHNLVGPYYPVTVNIQPSVGVNNRAVSVGGSNNFLRGLVTSLGEV